MVKVGFFRIHMVSRVEITFLNFWQNNVKFNVPFLNFFWHFGNFYIVLHFGGKVHNLTFFWRSWYYLTRYFFKIWLSYTSEAQTTKLNFHILTGNLKTCSCMIVIDSCIGKTHLSFKSPIYTWVSSHLPIFTY